ncbi:heavy-metal-associated domain-containing protein [Erysipelothrix anatis]|uniref:heavy-metal-associated domain-containing protein n=1 Tax=Erysipelothrix anatis TaxID=2683713 RepID=UPI001358CC49|nr:heavy metal-associated domain-containing protein [Erysipelothrix anatis]
MEKEFKVTGMTCGGCVRHVTHAVQDIVGVETVDVDLTSGIAKVKADASVTDAQIIEAINESGYSAQ